MSSLWRLETHSFSKRKKKLNFSHLTQYIFNILLFRLYYFTPTPLSARTFYRAPWRFIRDSPQYCVSVHFCAWQDGGSNFSAPEFLGLASPLHPSLLLRPTSPTTSSSRRRSMRGRRRSFRCGGGTFPQPTSRLSGVLQSPLPHYPACPRRQDNAKRRQVSGRGLTSSQEHSELRCFFLQPLLTWKLRNYQEEMWAVWPVTAPQ